MKKEIFSDADDYCIACIKYIEDVAGEEIEPVMVIYGGEEQES